MYEQSAVGSGFDVHAFGPGDSRRCSAACACRTAAACVAHSDGDVLLHALVDALLGAAGLGDIGSTSRTATPQWKGADSAASCCRAASCWRRRGWHVVNADLTLLAQSPSIGPWREQIRARAWPRCCGLPEAACVNLKATTTEHLGFIGRTEGLAAMATVLIERRSGGSGG